MQHQVKVSDFFMAKYVVTVDEYEAFKKEQNRKTGIDKNNSDLMFTRNEKKGKQYSIVDVSWNDATAYCEWLSNKYNVTFRLPTEAEWEYACRAGTTTPFNTGENLTTDQANYNGKYPYKNYPKGKYIGKTTLAGSYPPNAWGLYDMHGNVWEWCMDWYGKDYYNECKELGIVDNPQGPKTGSDRVLRGGGWSSGAQYCRSAWRGCNDPGGRYDDVGFRLVFVP